MSGGKAESIAERAFVASTDEEVKAWLALEQAAV